MSTNSEVKKDDEIQKHTDMNTFYGHEMLRMNKPAEPAQPEKDVDFETMLELTALYNAQANHRSADEIMECREKLDILYRKKYEKEIRREVVEEIRKLLYEKIDDTPDDYGEYWAIINKPVIEQILSKVGGGE